MIAHKKNATKINHLGREKKVHYIVLELYRLGDLGSLLDKKPFSPELCCHLFK
jgi:hypothetical protein